MELQICPQIQPPASSALSPAAVDRLKVPTPQGVHQASADDVVHLKGGGGMGRKPVSLSSLEII